MHKQYVEKWALEHHSEAAGWVYLGTVDILNGYGPMDYYLHPKQKLLSIVFDEKPGDYASPDWFYTIEDGFDSKVYSNRDNEYIFLFESMPHYAVLRMLVKKYLKENNDEL